MRGGIAADGYTFDFVPVRACRLIRKMRGKSQPHLIEAADGGFYVVKSTDNPQHRRTLVNEWLSSAILRYLGILVPRTALVEITPEFIAAHPDFFLSIGSRRQAIRPGVHFGSRLPAHPDQIAIFDFLPDRLLAKLDNRKDFLGTLVFDKWVGNTDSRQAIFFRSTGKQAAVLNCKQGARTGYLAQMIDHGFAFSGPHWQFQDSPLQGLYFRTSIYDGVRSLDSFGPWLELIDKFPVDVVNTARKEIPLDWIGEDGHELERMLNTFIRRRSHIRRLIHDVHRHRPAAFSNWDRGDLYSRSAPAHI